MTKKIRFANLYYRISTRFIRVLTGVTIMLTERQLSIFKVILNDFIKSAHPVGSQTISEKEHITISAATIRNVMAELEEMGYLEKTHTSSGRIPSEKGYRYYVDHILSSELDQYNDIQIIKHMLQDGFYELEQIVQTSANILSELTNYTSIILGPEIFDTKLEQFQIVILSRHTAVAILITNSGHVEHRSFTIPPSIHVSDLEKMVNILNDRLQGVPIARLPQMLDAELLSFMEKYVQNAEQSIEYIKDIFFYEDPIKLYFGGKSNILTQPEFKDINKIHTLFSALENEEEIANLLKDQQEGIKVTIGKENKIDAFKEFSLITTSFKREGTQIGTIALLGPTRMEYKKVIKLLNALSNEMSEAFDLWYQNKG